MKRNYTSIRGAGYGRAFQEAAAGAAPKTKRVPAAKPQEPRCDRSADAGSTHIWAPGATVGDFCLCGKRKRFTPFANYQRPEFTGSNFKAPRGSRVLEQERQKREDRAKENENAKAVKRLDGRCRWPERHRCRYGVEAAHYHDASTGGDYTVYNLITLCGWIHRKGPESIHGGQLVIEPLTDKGTRGPCAFWRLKYSETKAGEYRRILVARESAPGVIEL